MTTTVNALMLHRRSGTAPLVAGPGPTAQLSQTAPVWFQERLLLRGFALPGVAVRPSLRCVPGSRAWHMSPMVAHGPADAFLCGTEFGHLHPSYDGSLHLILPPECARAAVAADWGVRCIDGTVLLFGPRDAAEVEVLASLVRVAHAAAVGAAVRPVPARVGPWDGGGIGSRQGRSRHTERR